MMGFKPSPEIWSRVNQALVGENTAEVMVTLISGMCALLVQAGAVENEMDARAHLAAMLISPDTAPEPGSLLPELHAELARLRDGKWIQ
jgi:hypothetical protein